MAITKYNVFNVNRLPGQSLKPNEKFNIVGFNNTSSDSSEKHLVTKSKKPTFFSLQSIPPRAPIRNTKAHSPNQTPSCHH